MTATAFIHDPLLDTEAALPDPPGPPAPAALASVHELPVPAARLHLEQYRRRRFFAVLALTIAVLAATQLMGVSLTAFDPLADPAAVSAADEAPLVHVVRPGDTYGAIAASLGATSPVAAADALRQANGRAELAVGQRLVVDRTLLD